MTPEQERAEQIANARAAYRRGEITFTETGVVLHYHGKVYLGRRTRGRKRDGMSDDIVNDDWNFPIMAAMKKERKVAADLTARAEQAEAERDELKRQAQLYHADMMKVRSQRDIAEAERDLWRDAFFALEFDPVTGECLLDCGGDSVEGHHDTCVFIANLPDPKLAPSTGRKEAQ